MPRKANSRPTLPGVASAERTLQVLAAFRIGDGPLELAELAERTGLVKSTIMRLAVSLERYGFLVRTLEGRYTLGGEILRLAGVYGQANDLAADIQPVLEYLAAEIEETASFWVREGEERRCLFRVNSPLQLRLEVQPGTKRPMDHASSAMVLRHFTIGDGSELATVPYYTAGATTPHVASMSVPVFGIGQKLMGSLSISGPDSRLNAERANEVGPLLLQVGNDLSRRLGGHPYGAPTNADTKPVKPAPKAKPAASTGRKAARA